MEMEENFLGRQSVFAWNEGAIVVRRCRGVDVS